MFLKLDSTLIDLTKFVATYFHNAHCLRLIFDDNQAVTLDHAQTSAWLAFFAGKGRHHAYTIPEIGTVVDLMPADGPVDPDHDPDPDSIPSYARYLVFNPLVSATFPTIIGTNLSAEIVIAELHAGASFGEVVLAHPPLTEADVGACLEWSQMVMRHLRYLPTHVQS